MLRLSHLLKPFLSLSAAAFLTLMLGGSSCTAPNSGGCESNRDCPSSHQCVDGLCEQRGGCDSNADCPLGQICSTLTRECINSTNPGNGDGDGNGDGGDGDGKVDPPKEIEYDDQGDGPQISCMPDNRYCEGGNVWICADGTDYEMVDCEGRGCSDGYCVVCDAGQAACDMERNMLVECSADGSFVHETPCAGGSCNPDTLSCDIHVCMANENFCRGNSIYECASDHMSYEFREDCGDHDLFCSQGRCVTECEKAVIDNSYIGCEYWPVVLTNVVDSSFRDDFAVVVANPHSSKTATVQVFNATSSTPIRQTTVAPGEVATVRLPWNALVSREPVTAGSTNRTLSAKGTIAYRLTSDLPVTAYQFNPLTTSIPVPSPSNPTYSHTNDASLLLPTHVYAPPGEESTYFVMSVAHQRRVLSEPQLFSTRTTNSDWAALVAVVATEDNTTVTVRARGGIAAGGGHSGTDPGGTLTFTLNRHEVMQLASRPYGNPTRYTLLEEPDLFGTYRLIQEEYRDSDLTGSIVTANKPVAVYSGADCYYMPFNRQACDHMEEQLFPVENLGSNYVAARTKLAPGATEDPGDIWRIVAAVNNTQLTFEPPVHPNVTLHAGEWLQIQTPQNFIVRSQSAEYPIAVGQFMVGQEATLSDMGDPSMILAVPRSQYRANYAFTTPTTIAKNYINVVRPAGAEVLLNGEPITEDWISLGDVEITSVEIPGGNHSITSEVRIGVTVYGYDAYVSYGYPAGMDLTRNVGVSLPW